MNAAGIVARPAREGHGMNRLQLWVGARAYALSLNGQLLARMEGGASALLAGAGDRLREADIEVAIERAEDWLMPSSKSWQGVELHVQDDAGRLRARLGATAILLPEQVERDFSRAVADVTMGRPVDNEAIADLVLLRELVHHGAVPSVVFDQQQRVEL
jgi:hypothetical protein